MAANKIHYGKIAIPSQPATPIHYTFVPGSGQLKNGLEPPLVVFLSGLTDPRKIWTPMLRVIKEDGWVQGIFQPAMLLYDRFGSGETAEIPATEIHDAMDATNDLRNLIVGVSEKHLKIVPNEIDSLPIIFVALSFGGVIAELYAKKYPSTVIGLLLLDPAPTDTDGESWLPNPDAPDFKPETLPDGVTTIMLRKARAQHRASPYNPNTPNKEGIKWDNLSTYIPEVGRPQLMGPWKKMPLLTIMTHDPVPFAEQVDKLTGIPALLTLTYNSPKWFIYLEKLANLVPSHLRKGPIVAKGSGHFIPLEQPRLVATELKELIKKLQAVRNSNL
ncbi:hypothetical protein TMatcc_009750 [Talaromyces marneffei ATCC 18224]|uniref:AB hydrolase-1 domain-containing protein n=1 Tax=Talaromyces marneffei (strain ATCC 18224 / CBS 334.59 / QM 7333) TaxID=441960 RepID=B6QT32_TALMQ|nr:uncharacterized protein EYB26_008988 [Talaromyces marneffei]EEA19611.1 conserved hypothetical protein [Talaromyces marneffei ATCC 18224]KAE8547927.1 hypothetical protein EYB25_009720 [Talaromyces marneffei]QGA21278.1 hypothetical protein EYB26_008988 [Talaromyces marneffei]